MKTSITVLILTCTLALGCRQDTHDGGSYSEAQIVETLAGLSAQFSQAYMDGDADAMTALYTADGVIFPGNSEYIRGAEAIRNYWTLGEGRRITFHKMTPVEVEVSGSVATDFGHYEVSGLNGEEAWGPVRGKYVIVWKEGQDGQWRMYLDMWNSRPQQGE